MFLLFTTPIMTCMCLKLRSVPHSGTSCSCSILWRGVCWLLDSRSAQFPHYIPAGHWEVFLLFDLWTSTSGRYVGEITSVFHFSFLFCSPSLLSFLLSLADVGSGAPLNRIKCGTPFYGLRSVVAVLPAWWRFAQCLRRYRDSWNHPIHKKYRNQHLVNAGKYSTTFFVVLFSSLANVLKGE